MATCAQESNNGQSDQNGQISQKNPKSYCRLKIKKKKKKQSSILKYVIN